MLVGISSCQIRQAQDSMCTMPTLATLQVYLLGCTDPGSCVASLMRPLRSWSAPSPSSSDDHSSASETAASPSMNAAARLHGRTGSFISCHAAVASLRLLVAACMHGTRLYHLVSCFRRRPTSSHWWVQSMLDSTSTLLEWASTFSGQHYRNDL